MARSRVNCEELGAGSGGDEGAGPGAQGRSALGVLVCVLVVSGGRRVCVNAKAWCCETWSLGLEG